MSNTRLRFSGNWLEDPETDAMDRHPVPLWIIAAAVLGIGMIVGGLALAIGRGNRHAINCLIVAPILFLLTVPIARRYARLEKDPRYFRIILATLVLKFAGALVRYYVAFIVYRGNDAREYDAYGRYLAPKIRHGHLPDVGRAVGTGFMHYLTGFVYAVFGSSIVAGFLVFAWFAFLGLLLFWRAFRRAVPQGDGYRYALLVLLLPSLLYWDSSIGKEAWMMLSLGICAYAVSLILTTRVLAGLGVLIVGLAGCLVVRPHMALLIFIALCFAGLIRPPRNRNPLVTMVLLGFLLIAGVVILSQTKTFFGVNTLTQESITTTLDETASQTAEGGSHFSPVRASSGIEMPWATVTVLFRPLPFDAHNAQSALSALEGSALIALTLASWKRVANAIRQMRESSYVAFAVGYILVFVYAFSSFSNFGVLARQRTQILPFYLVLLALPPRERAPARLAFDEEESALDGAR